MKKALVIVDMQNDFIDGALGNAGCKAAVSEVLQLVESGTYDCFLMTQDTHFNDYLETMEGKKLPVTHCVRGTEGWKIHPEIETAVKNRNVKVIYHEKSTFGSMALADCLRKELADCDEIDFCGVCTGICVISNVLIAKAAVPEKIIAVVEKACACVTPKSHQTAIEAMKTCQVDIL